MSIGKSSSKVYIILIICAGVVISTWLISNNPAKQSVETKTVNEVLVNRPLNTVKNDDWKKILVSVNTKNETVASLLKNNTEIFDESTLTAQMSRDILSRYLLLAKSGEGITPELVDKMVEEILALPDYTKINSVIYKSSNLNVILITDSEVVKKYKEEITNIFLKINATNYNEDNPIFILTKAMETESEEDLKKLLPIIANRKVIIKELLNVETPKEAIIAHLSLINAYSNVVTNLDALYAIFSDPVSSLVGIAQYDESVNSLKIAIGEMNKFLTK